MPPADLPVPPPYPNVTYGPGAINHLHGGLVVRATETLREAMGPDFNTAEVNWSAGLDDNGQPVYTLSIRVPEWNATSMRSYTGDDLGSARVLLYRFWGQMLRDQVARLLATPA
ncbi:MAG: hypothetical protein K2P78_06110 [Gemmataceae bacterium]|nr:hypothetical protein [Gemmataceae bacterium]